MRSSAALLMLALLLISQDAHGWVWGHLPVGCEPCICLKTTSQFINPKRFARFQITSPGLCCQRAEIIITLKNGKIVCVNPDAKWINTFLDLVWRNPRANSSQ
ncbi:interleukin-8-like isoform X2 [Rhinatrema bivittatum]|uniref:interleukin-8-like isoform X2 n=1 Tax=Rhinatrema bivittatum TaxID=194408 RepID=UPI001125B85D|nr:interleukin-8-like isoform X2 [Rhinatrema bivittatum]